MLTPTQKVVPQFVVFTADDAVQSYTLDAVNQFLAHRKNPNGCQPKMTYYTSLNYTNYTLVTDWYVAGNEIAVRASLQRALIFGFVLTFLCLSGPHVRQARNDLSEYFFDRLIKDDARRITSARGNQRQPHCTQRACGHSDVGLEGLPSACLELFG